MPSSLLRFIYIRNSIDVKKISRLKAEALADFNQKDLRCSLSRAAIIFVSMHMRIHQTDNNNKSFTLLNIINEITLSHKEKTEPLRNSIYAFHLIFD